MKSMIVVLALLIAVAIVAVRGSTLQPVVAASATLHRCGSISAACTPLSSSPSETLVASGSRDDPDWHWISPMVNLAAEAILGWFMDWIGWNETDSMPPLAVSLFDPIEEVPSLLPP